MGFCIYLLRNGNIGQTYNCQYTMVRDVLLYIYIYIYRCACRILYVERSDIIHEQSHAQLTNKSTNMIHGKEGRYIRPITWMRQLIISIHMQNLYFQEKGKWIFGYICSVFLFVTLVMIYYMPDSLFGLINSVWLLIWLYGRACSPNTTHLNHDGCHMWDIKSSLFPEVHDFTY